MIAALECTTSDCSKPQGHRSPCGGHRASVDSPEVSDPINHPSHYTSIVPGIECIQVVEHLSFLRGNAIKYLWRAGAKGDVLEDLKKAQWYIQREIDNLQREIDREAFAHSMRPRTSAGDQPS